MHKANVLIVDDDGGIADEMKRTLRACEYNVDVAYSGEKGWECFREKEHDIVIVDWLMGKMSGMELLKKIDEKSVLAKVIMITGFGDENTAIQAHHHHAFDYLKKPVDRDALISVVDKANERRGLLIKALNDWNTKRCSVPMPLSGNAVEGQCVCIDDKDNRLGAEISYDVFLCYSRTDEEAVKRIGVQLRTLGINPWLDVWNVRPGYKWQKVLENEIPRVKSAAIFVGASGIGPWQEMEIDAFLRRFVNKSYPVIPVILPECHDCPELPIFLEGNTWVDFRKQDPEPLAHLIWGINGTPMMLG